MNSQLRSVLLDVPVDIRRVSDPIGRQITNSESTVRGKAKAVAEAEGLLAVTDTGQIEAWVDEAIAANPDKAAEIQAGNENLINWFTGQVMKASRGKANPKQVGDLLRGKLL